MRRSGVRIPLPPKLSGVEGKGCDFCPSEISHLSHMPRLTLSAIILHSHCQPKTIRVRCADNRVRYLNYMKTFWVIFVAFSLCLAATSVRAEGDSIRGVVIDAKGKPVAGAEIRAERTDSKGPAAVATTDVKGQYALNHLA